MRKQVLAIIAAFTIPALALARALTPRLRPSRYSNRPAPPSATRRN